MTRRSKRELEAAVEDLAGSVSRDPDEDVDLSSEQAAAIRELFKYRYNNTELSDHLTGGAGLSSEDVRVILDHMPSEQEGRILETLSKPQGPNSGVSSP